MKYIFIIKLHDTHAKAKRIRTRRKGRQAD